MPTQPSNLRRFYFDDGSSRKRWQVGLKGKTRVVLHGRLQGTPKETRKVFVSPVEAKQDTEKLIASKLREGYREVDPSRLEIVRPKGRKAATDAALKAFEKRIGSVLPDEYREFLATKNGGRPNPDCVEVPGMAHIANVGVGTFFYLAPSKPTTDELTHEFERLQPFLPEGYLPIAGSSDVFTISLKPKTFGCVHWWNHDVDPDVYAENDEDEEKYVESQGYLLAGSFDEFLTRISYLFAGEEEAEEPPTPADATKKGGAPKKKAAGTGKATFRKLRSLLLHQHTPEKIREIEQVVRDLGDLSQIEDGAWPFINIDDAGLLKTLLDAGLNPEILDEDRQTLLWQCAGSVPCVDLLVERGVDLERRSGGEQETALMRAMFLEALPAVARLIEAGANPTVQLRWYIGNNLKRNKALGDLVEKARVRWRKRKETAKAKRAKKSSAK